jgi:hypothetical protein
MKTIGAGYHLFKFKGYSFYFAVGSIVGRYVGTWYSAVTLLAQIEEKNNVFLFNAHASDGKYTKYPLHEIGEAFGRPGIKDVVVTKGLLFGRSVFSEQVLVAPRMAAWRCRAPC